MNNYNQLSTFKRAVPEKNLHPWVKATKTASQGLSFYTYTLENHGKNQVLLHTHLRKYQKSNKVMQLGTMYTSFDVRYANFHLR